MSAAVAMVRCASCRLVAEPCLGWEQADGAWCCPGCQDERPAAIYTLDGECPSTLDEIVEANQDGLDPEDFRAIAALAVGESLVLGGGAAAECRVERVR